MEETTRQRLVNSDIWIRALYMVLFAIAFGIARFIIGFLVIFQFFAVLFTGQVNEPLLQFGKNLVSTFPKFWSFRRLIRKSILFHSHHGLMKSQGAKCG